MNISKQAVLEIIESIEMDLSNRCYDGIVKQINALPSISDGWISDKLFSAFIKSLLDSGVYSVSELKNKDLETMTDAYHYWVDALSEYPISQPKLPPSPTKQTP